MNLGDYADDLTTLTLVAGAVVGISGAMLRWVIVPSVRREIGAQPDTSDQMLTLLTEVREQVANTHKTNLREDIDAMHADVRSLDAKLDVHLIDAAGDKQRLTDVDRRVTKAGF